MKDAASSRWDACCRSGGTYITCAWHQGCGASFHGSHFTNARGARKEARVHGWLVNQAGGRRVGTNRHVRLDYCPEHAPRERLMRGMKSA